ncbi:gibberellin receptor GID1C-like [Wolffia australiana]
MAGSNELNNSSECKSVVPLNTWVLISNFKLAYKFLRRPDGTFNRDLAEFLDRKVPANASPVDGVASFDVVIDRATNLLCRVYRPASSSAAAPPFLLDVGGGPVVVFFHGGSFAHSSSNSAIYDALCRRHVSMCGAAVVVSVNYRRSPEFRFPCAYDDGWTALEWAVAQFSGPVFLAGDSSGGNIAHHVAARAAASGVNVAGNVLVNPMFGGEARTSSEIVLDGKYFVTLQDRDWYWRAFLPEGADRDHPACNPLGPLGSDLRGVAFPPSLVVVAGLDLVRDRQLGYAAGLERAGHRVRLLHLEQATIGFYLLPNNDHFFEVMQRIREFLADPGMSPG